MIGKLLTEWLALNPKVCHLVFSVDKFDKKAIEGNEHELTE